MQILGWLLLAVVMATAAPANDEYKNPMKFTIAIADNNIYADGEIDPDVAMRFATFLKEHNIPDLSFMVLNSPGGDLDAAFELGKLLRAHKFQVDVGVQNPNWPTTGPQFEPIHFKGECISACTFVYMGAPFRFLHEGSQFGIHQFKFKNEVKNPVQVAQQYSGEIVAYLKMMGVKPEFLTLMSRVDPKNYLVLGPDVLRELGIVNDGQTKTVWIIDGSSDGKGLYLKAEKLAVGGTSGMLFSCSDKGLQLIVSMSRDKINDPPISPMAHELVFSYPWRDLLKSQVFVDITPWFQQFQVQGDTYIASFLLPPASTGQIVSDLTVLLAHFAHVTFSRVGYAFDTKPHPPPDFLGGWEPWFSDEKYEFLVWALEIDEDDRPKIKAFFGNCHLPD